MSVDPFLDTLDRLEPHCRAGELATCESMAIAALQALPKSPFHIASRLSITNDPGEAAQFFDGFYQLEADSQEIAAVYTEMNGFDINPDRWFCDLFAYGTDGGLEDFDWLGDWDSAEYDDYTLTGLEELQAAYASEAYREPAFRDAGYLSSIVVVTKFQRFIQKAAKRMTKLSVPLYATAHDYDYIARIIPG